MVKESKNLQNWLKGLFYSEEITVDLSLLGVHDLLSSGKLTPDEQEKVFQEVKSKHYYFGGKIFLSFVLALFGLLTKNALEDFRLLSGFFLIFYQVFSWGILIGVSGIIVSSILSYRHDYLSTVYDGLRRDILKINHSEVTRKFKILTPEDYGKIPGARKLYVTQIMLSGYAVFVVFVFAIAYLQSSIQSCLNEAPPVKTIQCGTSFHQEYQSYSLDADTFTVINSDKETLVYKLKPGEKCSLREGELTPPVKQPAKIESEPVD